MSGRYAAGTEVAPERSRAEIEATLRRYGHADAFAYGRDGDREIIGFRIYGRYVRFTVTMPLESDPVIQRTPGGKYRSPREREVAIAAEHRRRWRVLLLQIKARLEVIEAEGHHAEAQKQAAAEREFMAYLLLPDGRTMAEYVGPQLARLYDTGQMPALLPGLRADDLPRLDSGHA